MLYQMFKRNCFSVSPRDLNPVVTWIIIVYSTNRNENRDVINIAALKNTAQMRDFKTQTIYPFSAMF